ncbi:hypothetical protein GCM10010236_79160 [Streptomyces eurythermus]|nr:hypothetical protein GCM10010236_79160 [Streptomyces eurythermus]
MTTTDTIAALALAVAVVTAIASAASGGPRLQPGGDGRFYVVGDQASPLPGWQEGAALSAQYVTAQTPRTAPKRSRPPTPPSSPRACGHGPSPRAGPQRPGPGPPADGVVCPPPVGQHRNGPRCGTPPAQPDPTSLENDPGAVSEDSVCRQAAPGIEM